MQKIDRPRALTIKLSEEEFSKLEYIRWATGETASKLIRDFITDTHQKYYKKGV